MTTVTGMTAARMQAIEDESIVNGAIAAGHLILTRHIGTTIDAGSVVGPTGPTGATGPAGATSIAVATSTTRPTGGALFQGLGLWETDTKRFYIYDGAAWKYQGGLWICTSGTRPASPFSGLEIFETDTFNKYIYDGTQWVLIHQRDWTTFVPTLNNNAQPPVTKTVSYARYKRLAGNLIHATVNLASTAISAGTGQIVISLPVNAAAALVAGSQIGSGTYKSSGLFCFGAATLLSNSTVTIARDGGTGAGVTSGIVNGDTVSYDVTYEAATF